MEKVEHNDLSISKAPPLHLMWSAGHLFQHGGISCRDLQESFHGAHQLRCGQLELLLLNFVVRKCLVGSIRNLLSPTQ